MSETLDPTLLDKRTLERHIRNGVLDPKAVETFLKGLPDTAEKAAPVEVVLEASADDEEEDSSAQA